MTLVRCPNCRHEFFAFVPGAYCEKCWSAWCKGDKSFERRKRPAADLIATDPTGPKPSDAILALLDTPSTKGQADE